MTYAQVEQAAQAMVALNTIERCIEDGKEVQRASLTDTERILRAVGIARQQLVALCEPLEKVGGADGVRVWGGMADVERRVREMQSILRRFE